MRGLWKKVTSVVLVAALIVTICPQGKIFTVHADDVNEPYNISYGRPVYASSQNGNDAPENAVDGDDKSRWQAAQSDKNEWFYVDLGKEANIDHLYIHWEAARAKSYEIQFSNDEENWNTVYTKGKGQQTTPSEPTGMSISYEVQKMTDGVGTILAHWTSVDNATYAVYVDEIGEEHYAKAPDGYKFSSHGPNQGQMNLSQGTHKLIVIALDKDTKQEVGRGEMDIEVEEGAGGEEEEETSGEIVDKSKETITFDDLSAEQKRARYVKIVCTERSIDYGCSFYEFQVYGTDGMVKRPENYGVNLALNKTVTAKYNDIIQDGNVIRQVNVRDEWWMYDSDGNLMEDAYKNVKPENAVDGDSNTTWTSYQGDDQWIYVDLEKEYTIGRVVLNWNADAGKIYDVQVSSDAENWKTVHRVLKGSAYKKDNFTIYQENVRYVRMFGYTKVEHGSGFGVSDFEVYEYREGDSKENETIPELPKREIISNPNGKGSYVSGEMYNEKNKLPTFVNPDTIKTPVDSNSWWSSAMIQVYSNLLCSTPLKTSFSKKGLGVLTATAGWVGVRTENDLGTDQSTETGRDFYITPENFDANSGYDRVEDYGDYSVKLGLMDDNELQMTSTVVKGSPYIFNEFCNNTVAYISGSTITELFDGNGNPILANKGDTVITDHIGFTSVDEENAKAKNDGAYYCVNVPEGTQFKVMVAGSNYKIKVTFPSAKENYMSVAAMTKKTDIDSYYKHGYAFITNTHVDYSYNHDNSKIITTYTATTEVKRSGFSNVTMHCMFPHQWKHTDEADNPAAVYPSIRGDMKSIWSNVYHTTQQFSGLLPTFAKPDSEMFNTEEMIDYLNQVVASKVNAAPVSDAYWEGKNVHPLAISAIMADQLGETEIKEKLLAKLKSIMIDWFNYDGEEDRCYLIYNKDWGTVYYPDSAYGANAAICDHHFTYGYFMFGAAVLATYDKEFYNEYKDMVEILVRDYACPDDNDELFCKFRAFDQYSGHSWAGGYADSDSGNNQESASEALFSWVGMYLWGEATQNTKYIDAGAYGFTTEMDAIEQYWFDYDETNWLPEYPFEGTGQIYGASMGYGTFFGGQPVYVYGIQWLPISEYLTNYGMNQEKCAKIYQGLVDDTQYAINIEKRLYDQLVAEGKQEEAETWHNPDTYVTPDNGWQHITWPFLSQTDAKSAYEKFEANVTKVQTEDRANTLWFISAMDAYGYRTNDYMVVGDIQGSVYVKNGKYTAQVWNPTEKTQTVTIKKADGTKVGTAAIGSKATVAFEIKENSELQQAATPNIKATSVAEGTVTDNISGIVTFDDTQMVELSTTDEGVTIYYTTDGSTPTIESAVYEGKFLVSSNTTIKAIAIGDGYIDSAYSSAVVKIDGDKVESSENLALNKNVSASSTDGGKVPENAVDGNEGTMWQGDSADDEYFQVDLGSVQAVNTVNILWEAAYAEKYEIQVSIDGETWQTVAKESGMAGWMTSNFAAVNARYVRMQGVQRGTQYGYGIKEFEVYGALQAVAPVVSPVSGTYEGNQTITMSTTVKGSEIKYTLDGSEPIENSLTYTEPVTVEKSTVVKAITYRKGMILSDATEAIIIVKGTIALNKLEANMAIDRTVQLAAYTDMDVTWTSSDESIATVDGNGLVTGIKPGNADIIATIPNGKSETCKITVTPPVHIESISLSSTTLEMRNKSSQTLVVTVNPADTTDDTTATWKSSDENVLIVNENGTITAKSEGTATVTVTVGTFTAQCEVVVGPAATVKEMLVDELYNAALGKQVEISSIYANEGSQTTDVLTDGNIDGSYVSTDWDNSRTSEYLLVDLGADYETKGLDMLALKFVNEATFCNDYEIQYSENGVDFKTVAELNGVQYSDTDEGLYSVKIDAEQAALQTAKTRYVKVVMKGNKDWGFQIREVAVLSTEQELNYTETKKCEAPADFSAVSNNPSEITYTIKAGVSQEGYKYIVLVDGKRVSEGVDAGTYTIKNVERGNHELQVMSYYEGTYSDPLSASVFVEDGSLIYYIDSDMNLAKNADVTVESIYENEGSQDPKTLTDGKISKDLGNVVETVWGEKTATITIDLGKNISKNMVDEIIMAFKADNTNATEYNVQFSEDGTNYEKVLEKTDVAYKEALEDKVDVSNYSKETVRYVQVNLTGGNCTWGYQLSEIAVMKKNININSNINVEGYQISVAHEGFRVVGSVEDTINNQKVKSWGFIYALANVNGKDTGVVDDDVFVRGDNYYVKAYQSTASGTLQDKYSESETATNYARVMKFGAFTVSAYTAKYKVRAYAILEDGTYVYSKLVNFSVFDVASYMYDNRIMSTKAEHDYLYDKILTKVQPDYKYIDKDWSPIVKPVSFRMIP